MRGQGRTDYAHPVKIFGERKGILHLGKKSGPVKKVTGSQTEQKADRGEAVENLGNEWATSFQTENGQKEPQWRPSS